MPLKETVCNSHSCVMSVTLNLQFFSPVRRGTCDTEDKILLSCADTVLEHHSFHCMLMQTAAVCLVTCAFDAKNNVVLVVVILFHFNVGVAQSLLQLKAETFGNCRSRLRSS